MKKLLLFILSIYASFSLASLELGTGYSSSHSGRMVPTFAGAITSSSFALSAYSAGVKNKFYFHNAYGLHAFGLKKLGTLLGGDVVGGAGVGFMYSRRNFKDTDSHAINSDDYVFGPAIRVNWTFLKVMYVNVDATYGVRDIGTHIFMNFQDVISTSIGVRIW